MTSRITFLSTSLIISRLYKRCNQSNEEHAKKIRSWIINVNLNDSSHQQDNYSDWLIGWAQCLAKSTKQKSIKSSQSHMGLIVVKSWVNLQISVPGSWSVPLFPQRDNYSDWLIGRAQCLAKSTKQKSIKSGQSQLGLIVVKS